MHKIYEYKVIDGDIEATIVVFGGLTCPNPRETYLRTRSYLDMRAEYDILHCGEHTDEDVIKLAITLNKMTFWQKLFS